MRRATLHLKTADPVLAVLIDQVGPPRIPRLDADFTTLARSIVFQQLSAKVARVIYDRVLAAASRGGRLSPGKVLRLGAGGLRPLGLSRQKAAYLVDLAGHTQSRRLKFRELPHLTDEEVIARLTQVKGIGVWTAQMFLIFALGRPDVLPTGDLGIRSAMKRLYALDELPKPPQIERLAASWRPYCSIACWYLWRSLDGPAGI